VAVSREEKAEIAARGADAVEMEAAAVAAEAAARRLPFYCVRVVSDGAGEELPLDFNRFRGAEGRFSRWRITAALLVHPSRLMPMLRFHRACGRAAELLGEFLVHCRF
jgi:adenosylhomocysteine nucleosidase